MSRDGLICVLMAVINLILLVVSIILWFVFEPDGVLISELFVVMVISGVLSIVMWIWLYYITDYNRNYDDDLTNWNPDD